MPDLNKLMLHKLVVMYIHKLPRYFLLETDNTQSIQKSLLVNRGISLQLGILEDYGNFAIRALKAVMKQNRDLYG